MRAQTVAVLGAGGAVGGEIVRQLASRSFPVGRLVLLATARSAGQRVMFRGEPILIETLTPDSFADVDLAFCCASTEASREYAPQFVQHGAVVVDKSNAFRMDPAVPLVIPEVNPGDIYGHGGIIASPNCSTIQLVVALKPLHDEFGLRRIIISTYQAVSGSGREAMEELERQLAEHVTGEPVTVRVYPRQIAQNVLPHIDAFDAHGDSGEELKLVNETRKILHLPHIRITATTVRVPVLTGHAESVYIETERPLNAERVRALLDLAPGVTVMDDPRRGVYPTPLDAAGCDDVLVGRIREDYGSDRALSLWIVSDNLRKGAATNAVQIAEWMLARGLL